MFSPLRESMTGRAIDNGIIELNIVDIRDYTADKHNRVDDTPYGGGAGMVMQAQPIMDAFRQSGFGGDVIYMSPRGEMLSPELVSELSEAAEITILCGHYEGVDQRALDMLGARDVSIGDYVLTGGELPAMVLIDAVSRFIPGVLSSEESAFDESIYSGLLEYPQYSRPAVFEGEPAPDIRLSGDHGEVDIWRWEQSLALTKERRPDLFDKYVASDPQLTKRQKKILEKYLQQNNEK